MLDGVHKVLWWEVSPTHWLMWRDSSAGIPDNWAKPGGVSLGCQAMLWSFSHAGTLQATCRWQDQATLFSQSYYKEVRVGERPQHCNCKNYGHTCRGAWNRNQFGGILWLKHKIWLPDTQQATPTMTCFTTDLFALSSTCNPSSWQLFQQNLERMCLPIQPTLSSLDHTKHIFSAALGLYLLQARARLSPAQRTPHQWELWWNQQSRPGNSDVNY